MNPASFSWKCSTFGKAEVHDRFAALELLRILFFDEGNHPLPRSNSPLTKPESQFPVLNPYFQMAKNHVLESVAMQ
jgi:hypothetical protein